MENGPESNSFNTFALRPVTFFLHIDKILQAAVQEIAFRPDFGAVRRAVSVMAMRCQSERNLIFVIIVLYVGSQTHENRKVSVGRNVRVVNEAFGVDPHLQPRIVPQILGGVAIYSSRVSAFKIRHFK